MVHMSREYGQGTTGRQPYPNGSTAGSGSSPEISRIGRRGEHDAGSFQLGFNPYPFDVALRAGHVLPQLVGTFNIWQVCINSWSYATRFAS